MVSFVKYEINVLSSFLQTNILLLCALAGLLATAASAALNNASGSCVGRQVIGGSCENSSEQEGHSQTGMQIAESFYFLCTF